MPASFSNAASRLSDGAAAGAAARAAARTASAEAGAHGECREVLQGRDRVASAEAGATLLLLLLLPAGLFAGGAGEGAIGRFLAAPLAAAAAAAAGAGAGAVARAMDATDAEVGATLLPRFFAGSLGIVPRSGGVLRPPDRRGTFDITAAIGSPAACAPASARANDRVREKNIVVKRGLFRIRARQGTTGGHSSPSGPAAAHLELRIAVLVS